MELVEALFQGHLAGERDYAVIISMGIGTFANYGVAHLQSPGINPQYSHHTAHQFSNYPDGENTAS